MTPMAIFAVIRPLRAACFLASVLGAAGIAYATVSSAPAVVAQTAVPAALPQNSAAPPAAAVKTAPAKQQSAAAKPLWSNLTPAQQQALAPLAGEWDKLEATRKTKWLAIGNKYASMKPDEQQRVQARMREWVKLTPEQRRIARESYARAKKLNSNQKSEHWQQYQQLSEEQKKKLAADAPSRRNHVATLPSGSQGRSKTVPPIKSAPKPVLEQSVTPQAAAQSALQPSPQPATK